MCNSFDYSVAYNAKSWKHICKRLIKLWYTYIRSSQGALVVKHLPANAGDVRCRFDPWVMYLKIANSKFQIFSPQKNIW